MADTADNDDRANQTAAAARRRPTIAPMLTPAQVDAARTRPPMTPLPPLAPKPPPPPEPVVATVKKKGSRVGLWLTLFLLLTAAGAGAYYQFMP